MRGGRKVPECWRGDYKETRKGIKKKSKGVRGGSAKLEVKEDKPRPVLRAFFFSL
jgi:hypothetical protein